MPVRLQENYREGITSRPGCWPRHIPADAQGMEPRINSGDEVGGKVNTVTTARRIEVFPIEISKVIRNCWRGSSKVDKIVAPEDVVRTSVRQQVFFIRGAVGEAVMRLLLEPPALRITVINVIAICAA